MSAEKADAIVLRVVEFSETSCVVTLLTREFGKISALAKGARRRKSPFEGALDVLSVVRVVFLRRQSGGLELLTEAKLERRFRSSSTDLGRYYAATYLCDLLTQFTETDDQHEEVFDCAVASITAIDSADTDAGLELLRFEMHLLNSLGHSPMLDACAGCGSDSVAEPDADSVRPDLKSSDRSVQPPLRPGTGKPVRRIHFGLLAGGLLCSDCRSGQMQVVTLSADALRLMKRLQSDESVPDVVSALAYGQVRALLCQFENGLLGRRPHSQKWLKSVRTGKGPKLPELANSAGEAPNC